MIWYLYLFIAISLEVLGTMLLPLSQNFSKLIPTVVLLFAYATSFYFLALVSQKLPLAVIYSSWAGLGVFSVAILSNLTYGATLKLENNSWPIYDNCRRGNREFLQDVLTQVH